MADPRNPFRGVLGGRLPLLEGGLSGRGGARPSLPKRGPGFSRQRQLDLERAVRQAEQNILNQRAQEAQRQLKLRGDRALGVDKNVPLSVSDPGKGSFSPDPRKVSGRLLKERTEPLEAKRRAEAIEKAGPTLQEGGQKLARTFSPLRLNADQVEATVTKFARPVTARDIQRGGFQAVTRENAPAQELEARLAQVGTREATADIKVAEPVGFQRTEFRFTKAADNRGIGAKEFGILIGTVTEIPANNPAQKMVFVSLRTEGVPDTKGEPIVFLVSNRLSALGVIDQVREDFHGLPLPMLEIPRDREFFIPPRQVFPRPPIPFDRLEKNRIVEFEGLSVARPNPFSLNPSLRTALRMAGPLSRDIGPEEIVGGLRGFVRDNGDVVLFPIDLFHEEAIRILGLGSGARTLSGAGEVERFILEITRKGFEFFFDNPVIGRSLLRTEPNLRRLIRPDQLPTMLKHRPGSPSPRPTSPATTPKEPVL